jgi:cobalamin biosynthetic protein CobC
VTLVNPNNPDGAVADRETVLRLHDDVSSQGGYLVVDEAFADVAPGYSVAALAGIARYPRLIVLRSFGKFYGLAGVRLGFVIAAAPVVARFRELLGDWPVSADAIAVGLAAYSDDAWAERTRERLQRSANRLDDLLISSGLEIVGGTSLFRLARSEDARRRFDNLLRAGILARPFDHDPTLLRFGLPREQWAWQRLAEALRKP